jgi:hypothetical protein
MALGRIIWTPGLDMPAPPSPPSIPIYTHHHLHLWLQSGEGKGHSLQICNSVIL